MKLEKITNLNITYLSDESRMSGDADGIIFCRSAGDIEEALRYAAKNRFLITVQGARTGITGGAVPVKKQSLKDKQVSSCFKEAVSGEKVLVINVSKMKQVYSIRHDKAGLRIKAGAGLTLTEIEAIIKGDAFDTSLLDEESLENLEKLRKSKYFFPPDPTEKSASIGGVAANCASGSRTFHYRSARNFITALDIVLADSSVIKLNRNPENRAAKNSFLITASNGNSIKGVLPEIRNPVCKNAAGIFTEENMDLIDLFIGSEGILGINSAVEFLVIPEPEFINGILIFPPDRETNFSLAEYFRNEGGVKYNNSDCSVSADCVSRFRDTDIRSSKRIPENNRTVNKTKDESEEDSAGQIYAGSEALIHDTDSCRIAAVEYFDINALSLVTSYIKKGLFKSLFPFSAESSGGALYVEIHSEDKESESKVLEDISSMLERFGVDEACVFISDGEGDLLRMKDFRHSVPESVNMTIDRIRRQGNDITKLGTDLAVPDSDFRVIFDMYFNDLEVFSTGSANQNDLPDELISSLSVWGNKINEQSSAEKKEAEYICRKPCSRDLPDLKSEAKPSKLNYAVFGHIGDNHLHVNIIPRYINEYKEGKKLIFKWAEKAVSLGGTVSAEHGTGRLKKEYLEIMYSREELEKTAYIKSLFDPGFVINRGVMI